MASINSQIYINISYCTTPVKCCTFIGVISREMQIQAQLDRLNSGVDLCIFDTYVMRVHDFKGHKEEITLYKRGGIWVHPTCEN